MARPKLSKELVRGSPRAPASSTPITGPSRREIVRTRAKIPTLVLLPHGKSLIQKGYVPDIQADRKYDTPDDQHPPPQPDDDNPFDRIHDTIDAPMVSRHRRKRENQWQKWKTQTIPLLLQPYMLLLHATNGLRDPLPARQSCTCDSPGKTLQVYLVRFDVIEKAPVTICKCAPAALQLLDMGCFPSAPVEPELAVDLKVLEFVSTLFLNIAPNSTAWSKTVESFLSSRGYRLENQDSLRKRFSNALRWFNSLQDEVTCFVNSAIEASRREETDLDDGLVILGEEDHSTHSPRQMTTPSTLEPLIPDLNSPVTPSRVTFATSPPQARKRKRRRHENEDSSDTVNPFPDPLPRQRPSDYLRSACPLCFGGTFQEPNADNDVPQAIVCVDACFTQKRNSGARDPPRSHPCSVFVPESEVEKMERYVAHKRPTNPRPQKRTRREEEDEACDHYEGPLRVPKSVLDDCEASFTAADDRREKASTQFFDDTALMALVCRHDVVLFLANVRSAGEKQHYVYVLIETLFQHLPQWFRLGVLYDIGCQLERSCIKWNFLDRYLKRMVFGISVFHAFGHQWACQIVYHPRKREGFGLTDGEGCERVWHSISKLIAVLRVCGYHQRLYTLDRQIYNTRLDIFDRMGQWLLKRTRHTSDKRASAEAILHRCGQSQAFLRSQWSAQVAHQTKPLPKRRASSGKDALQAIIDLRKGRDVLKERIKFLEEAVLSGDSGDDVITAEADLAKERVALRERNAQITHKQAMLGVSDRQKLERLLENPYYTVLTNMRALQKRLLEKLRLRKFELERLGRSFQKHSNNNEKKLTDHTTSAVKRREPTITRLARLYNEHCATITRMIDEKKAPRRAQRPSKIDLKGLFSLDVDSDIWQDVDVEDDDASRSEPPAWLAVENVREGIKALLERDRCMEEENRLRHECRSMVQWFSEEWK
ncbi:hypothetical protein H0H93_004459, partial [Arthromyces matolae]